MKKLLLSIGVAGTFVIYNHFAHPDDIISPLPSGNTINSGESGEVNGGNNLVVSTPTATPTPTSSGMGQMSQMKRMGRYKDGIYTGSVADAFYGNIQVRVTITNGMISDVTFLQSPNDRRTSVAINSYAKPILAEEAISAQSASVNIVSGATDSSRAFIESLSNALQQAS